MLRRGRALLSRRRAILVVLGLLILGLGVGALAAGGDSERPAGRPAETSVAELQSLAAASERPIYWAGTAPGTRLEVTRTAAGNAFVRYLPPSVKVADKRPEFLTVATYPYRRAYATTLESSRRKGMAKADAPSGGIAAWSKERPTSVYVAYPGSDFLVEVFSPKDGEARRLVLEGDVGPVERR